MSKYEPQYFNGFKKYIESNPIYKDMVLVEIEPCGAETMRVIGQAEEYVRKNKITKGQIWCVYDKDSFPAERFNGVLERAEALNLQNAAAASCFWIQNSFWILNISLKMKDYAKYPSLVILRPDEVPVLTWLSPVLGALAFYLSYKLWMKGGSKYDGSGS